MIYHKKFSFIYMIESINTLKKELIQCIYFLHSLSFAPATSSNYSFRVEEDSSFFISASGIDKGLISTNDLMQVNAQGLAINDIRKPSAETLLHVLIYAEKIEAHCILHSHSIYNTVLSELFRNEERLVLEGFEIMKAFPGITTHDSSVEVPIFPNSQDMPSLSTRIREYWHEHPGMLGFLLSGHGFYTWGTSIAEAKKHMEAFEFLFETYYRIKTFPPKP
ncbi:MAG: methylthioribulose-1-phosphate dehydratase [Saprospiraceae bacterium]|jgi:methylthioribulose-1-phosphate dehydratase